MHGAFLYNTFEISIHALRGEGDTSNNSENNHPQISIHALRGEGDTEPIPEAILLRDFNPRPPWGGRPYPQRNIKPAQKFQSTPSVGRATRLLGLAVFCFFISIHALRGEGDYFCLLKIDSD